MSAPFVEHAQAEAAEQAAAQGGRVATAADAKRSRLTVVDQATGEQVPAIVDADSGVVVSALQFARDKLDLPELVGVVNHSAELPRFSLVLTDGRSFSIGGTRELRSPTKVSDVIADATDKYPPAITAPKFRHVANALRAIAVLDDDEVGPTDEASDWIAQWLKARLITPLDLSSDEGRADAATKGYAAIHDTAAGTLLLYLPDLHQYVRQQHLSQTSLTRPELVERLKRLGFTKATVTKPRGAGGKQRQRKYWAAPLDPAWGVPDA